MLEPINSCVPSPCFLLSLSEAVPQGMLFSHKELPIGVYLLEYKKFSRVKSE